MEIAARLRHWALNPNFVFCRGDELLAADWPA